ncbi:MAG: DUF1501 domain-containing protein [Planctomycetota bacterium]|jgi:hypothetical protein
MAKHQYCDGIDRRDFVRFGALTGFGLSVSMPGYLSAKEAGRVAKAAGKAAIFVNLPGGPSHMDTFDLKPDAPDTHRGEFDEIKTNVPGIRISEHLPKLAQCADKYAILRGVSHTLAAHKLGQQYLTTGNRPLPSLAFPTYGAVVSKMKNADPAIPPFVAIPNQKNDPTGYLGVENGPFETGKAPVAGRRMDVRGLALTNGMTVKDLDRRQSMLNRYDNAFGSFADEDKLLSGMDQFSQRAYAMMRSPKTRQAFDLTKESPAITAMFGDDSFSQSCLLATRLVEAGSKFVTVSFGGWDTHNDNFGKLKSNLLPKTDAALAGLFTSLEAKGMLETTAVFVTGEFGRTPKIDHKRGTPGRNHYPRNMFCLLAGGGIRGGQVIGESDALGEAPKNDAITPDDVAASFYKAIGLDHTHEFQTPSGRPVMLVRYGNPIERLWG